MRKQNLISDEGFSRLENWYTRLLEDLCNEGNDGTESGATKNFILAVAQFILLSSIFVKHTTGFQIGL